MKKATRYLVGILALGFFLAGVIVFLRTLTGERMERHAPDAVRAGERPGALDDRGDLRLPLRRHCTYH